MWLLGELDIPKQALLLETVFLLKHVRSAPSRKPLWLGLIYGEFIMIRVLIKIDISKTTCEGALL